MTVVVRINIGDLGDWEAKLGSRLDKALAFGLAETGKSVCELLRQRSALIADTREFQEGWRSELESDTRLRVFNKAPWAVWVELGRGPGKQPPIDAIIGWVTRHLGDPRLAFAVARSIGKRGIKARPVMLALGMHQMMAEIATKKLNEALLDALTDQS